MQLSRNQCVWAKHRLNLNAEIKTLVCWQGCDKDLIQCLLFLTAYWVGGMVPHTPKISESTGRMTMKVLPDVKLS